MVPDNVYIGRERVFIAAVKKKRVSGVGFSHLLPLLRIIILSRVITRIAICFLKLISNTIFDPIP